MDRIPTKDPAAASAMAEVEPEYHVELKSGKTLRLVAAGVPVDADEGELAEYVSQQVGQWAQVGACVARPAPGWTTAPLVVIPWSSVDSIGLVVPCRPAQPGGTLEL